MGRVRRRRGNRRPVVVDKKVTLLVYGGRIDGEILDATQNGLGVLLPADCQLEAGQKVRILYRRQIKLATIARIVPREDGILAGIKL